MKTFRVLSAAAAGFAFVVVALSPLVRITGSGMGCGDDWPLCNGRLIPPLDDLAVMIEWGHRLAAAGVGVLVVSVAVWGIVRRGDRGVRGRGGPLRPALLAVVLLVAQVFLGAVTVWLELPPTVVVVHLANAMALLAASTVTALRTFSTAGSSLPPASPGAFRSATVAVALGAVALLLGALTANLDAGMACAGFPLCSGSLWPATGGLAHLHWAHRLVAYGLTLHVVGILVAYHRRGEPLGAIRAAWLVAAALGLHVIVAALMIAQRLPMPLRTAHAALGAAVWLALLVLAWRTAPAVAPATERSAETKGAGRIGPAPAA